MLVFRIEHTDGRGAYDGVWALRSRHAKDERRYRHGIETGFLSGQHPGPYSTAEADTKLRERFEKGVRHHFGFESWCQLLRWFNCPVMRKDLHDDGYAVSVYEVHGRHVSKGNKQLMFDKSKAKLIRRECLHV